MNLFLKRDLRVTFFILRQFFTFEEKIAGGESSTRNRREALEEEILLW